MSKSVVVGASTNPARYSYMAIHRLISQGFEVVPLGVRKGMIANLEILDLVQKPQIEGAETITMYINPQRQEDYIDYLIGLNPKRIIFNPGTENKDFFQYAENQGIEVLNACTLVMLSASQY